MERLAGEIIEGSVPAEEWCKRREIAMEAMVALFGSAARQWYGMVWGGDDPELALVDVVGQSFRLGWEACEQYGRKPAAPRPRPQHG